MLKRNTHYHDYTWHTCSALYLDCSIALILCGSMIHISLFACTDAAIDFSNQSSLQKLEENHPCPRVHHLLCCSPVLLILGFCSNKKSNCFVSCLSQKNDKWIKYDNIIMNNIYNAHIPVSIHFSSSVN